MTGDHDSLQRRQVTVDIRPQGFELPGQAFQLALDVDLPLAPDPLEIVDLTLELQQRLLKLQGVGGWHRLSRLHVVNRSGTEQGAKGANEIVFRGDSDAS